MQSPGAREILAGAVLVFPSVRAAEYLVAGIPAAARAAREIALAGGKRCVFVVPGGWTPSAWCRDELERLAPGLAWSIAETADAAEGPRFEQPDLAELRRASRALVAATGKAGDGIVSRYINRPVSQAISRLLLRLPGVTPFHATLGTMALGIAMAAALFLGGETGLIAGALLFQAASIFDGVDGEIARVTFRTSPAGARLDSLTDAATNLAFIAGLTANLWLQGYGLTAATGAAGLLTLATGLLLIGRRAQAIGGPFTFDLIKHHVRRRESRLMHWLTFLAMRDFIALACAVLVVLELAPHALIAFSAGAAIWLAVTISVLVRTRRA